MVQSKRKKNETGLLYLCQNGMIWLDGKGGGGGCVGDCSFKYVSVKRFIDCSNYQCMCMALQMN